MKKIITNLLLATIVILSSCSKEDDLLTPVTNPTNTTQVNDSTTYTVTGGDSTVLCPWDAEYVHDESLTTTTNNGTLVLEGSKYTITYSSFYLRNKWPVPFRMIQQYLKSTKTHYKMKYTSQIKVMGI